MMAQRSRHGPRAGRMCLWATMSSR
jgi:hypothetical protein